MNAKSTAELQRDYYERMKAQGFRKVCVYVPQGEQQKIHEFAKKLRDANAKRAKGK